MKIYKVLNLACMHPLAMCPIIAYTSDQGGFLTACYSVMRTARVATLGSSLLSRSQTVWEAFNCKYVKEASMSSFQTISRRIDSEHS